MVVALVLLVALQAIYKPASIKKVFSTFNKNAILGGLFLAYNYFGYMKGLEITTATNAQIMIQLGPLGLLFLGVFYFKETLTKKQYIGIFIALMGFILFNWDQISKVDGYVGGNIWIILAALTWALFAGLQKIEMAKSWSPQEFNIIVYLVCTVALYPMADLSELAHLSWTQYLILFSLGLNTLVAYGCFAEAIHRIPASVVSLIITCNPLLTILIVSLFAYFNYELIPFEPIEWLGYAGAILVVFGVGTAVYFRTRTHA